MRKLLLQTIFFMLLSLAGQAQSVYKTPTGKKYHLASCRMVENVSEKLSVEEALSRGLEACKICHPEVKAASTRQPDKQQGQAASVQCRGFTKGGTRCKHQTRIGNGYCFQHQPK